MIATGNLCPVSNTVRNMLCGAALIDRQERHWHSATFSGRRLIFSLLVAAEQHPSSLDHFNEKLADLEFRIPKMFVADICATASIAAAEKGRNIVTFEALLLEE